MHRVDLYRTVHKGLRALLFQTTCAVARTDFASAQEVADATAALRQLLAFLTEHSEHEDRAILPELAGVAPELFWDLRAEHARLDGMQAELTGLAGRLDRAAGEERLALGLRLCQKLPLLVAEHLRHLAREEIEVNRVLWAHRSDAELRLIELRMAQSIPAARLGEWMALMLPAMNVAERRETLAGMREEMPVEAFERVTAPARKLLGEHAWRACLGVPARSSPAGLALAASLALLASSCGHEARPATELPARLQDTGLYADFAARRVAADVLAYSPQYPQWSDGATARRWIRLPSGTAIDASNPDRWRFPVGTRLWQELAFDRPVETRYVEQVAAGIWRRATYLWSADGSDAPLAPAEGIANAFEHRPGVPYEVPGRAACNACHDGGGGPVLGFGALQLSPDRDPLAPGADGAGDTTVDLPRLVRLGLVRGLPERLLARPPRIAARTPRERAALGYLHANCGSCHNADGPLAGLGLNLGHRIGSESASRAALATLVGRPSSFGQRPDRPPSFRVAPGDARGSILLQRIDSRDPAVQMPPLGSHAVDATAVALIETWIRDDLRPEPIPLLTRKP